MTLPKRRLPGQAYGIAVRCARRSFRLVPKRFLRNLMGYALAKYSAKHEVLLHDYAFLSNHFHLVLTDVHGSLGDFMRDLEAALARALNLAQRERGQVFEAYRDWALPDYDRLLAHMAYVTLNPVAARVVRRPEAWPGLVGLPKHVHGPDTFDEPPEGLSGRADPNRPRGRATLYLLPPPQVSREVFARDFARELEAALPAELAKHPPGTVYPPRESLRTIPHTFAPNTDPGQREPPEIAGASAEDREGLREFQVGYREALELWRAGEREAAIFPWGTFRMVRLHRAQVAAPP